MKKENLLKTYPSQWTSRKNGYTFTLKVATRSDMLTVFIWLRKFHFCVGKFRELWKCLWQPCIQRFIALQQCFHVISLFVMLNKLADQKWLVLRLWIKWSRFESWPGSLHCVLGQDPLLSQYPSPPSCRDEMGTSEFNVGGNPAMDQHPIQGGVEILLVASCYRNLR